jgi:nitroreductase
MSEKNQAGVKNQDVLDYLNSRRSLSVKYMGDKGPNAHEVTDILKAAARVPDHGKLMPWHFIVLQGDKRALMGGILRSAYAAEHPEATPAKLDLEAQLFMRAPLVILVVSRMRKAKHPLWEQFLSSGAVCQNLLLAANALGYGANWLTEWYSYNAYFRKEIGLDERDNIAGVMYIGEAKKQPDPRPRPDMDEIVTYWDEGVALKKGDALYDKEGAELPCKKIHGWDD